MRSLSKKQLDYRDELERDTDAAWNKLSAAYDAANTEISEAHAALYLAVEAFNSAVTEALEGIAEPTEVYNGTLDDLREFSRDVAREIDDYISDRSDKWQESDRAEAYREWLSEWENYEQECSEMELPEFDGVECPDIPDFEISEMAPDLSALPEEVQQ